MGELEYRVVGDSDLPELIRLQGQLTPSSLETARVVLKRLQAYPDYRVYLALEDGCAVGTFALAILDNLGRLGTPFAVIENVVVEGSRRRQGIGRRMLAFAASASKAAGCYKLILASALRLEDAHRFYEAQGFRLQGYSYALNLAAPPPSA